MSDGKRLMKRHPPLEAPDTTTTVIIGFGVILIAIGLIDLIWGIT